MPVAPEQRIVKRIFGWYGTHARQHLPWRKTKDPYHILVSEIMLQQTQVERVIPKYRVFLKQFPTVQALANAKTADVISAWKGLGYNRRAIYLHQTAQTIVERFKGEFPHDLETLKTLPGIGDYTARAIQSFAFRTPVAMMDTNHRRFYQRVFFGLNKKKDVQLLKKAHVVIESTPDIYHWNQALMDFGSLVCLSQRPKCETCPIRKYCHAYPKILLRKKRGTESRQFKSKSKDAGLPFEETDRYFRGRIIDLLRAKENISVEGLARHFPKLSASRIALLVASLEKDGLIVQKKGRILLP